MMRELILQHQTDYGSEEIFVAGDKISFGRGSDADYRFEDRGLSRLHATVYREGDRIWIVDENSSNGTFVNGEKVGPNGTPLKDGDTIKIGNTTSLFVELRQEDLSTAAASPATAGSSATQTVSSGNGETQEKSSLLLPLAITAVALLIVGASIVFIGVTAFGNGEKETVRTDDKNNGTGNIFEDPLGTDEPTETPAATSPTATDPTGNATGNNPPTNNGNPPINTTESTELTDSPVAKDPQGNPIKLPTGKKYLQMSDAERRQYIAVKSIRVARMIGNQNAGSIPPLAITRIKGFTDAYAKRINVSPRGGCRFGDNLQSTYERASKNAPFINRAFKSHGIDPQIGLYLAMIESEHCVCLQSPTGPLGMFQFTRATGRTYGLSVRKDASPTNGDERCEPQPAAIAAAKYMKFLTGRYGTGPSSVPLAIGSYNSGEGGLSRNLKTALESNEGLPRDFWTLIANGDKLSKQFQAENFKYVPKFFAAAIVGENPKDFGLNLRPLSTYSN
jgi:pSer/pThr/pTyr-binding forkhead associated (FHA) protein